MNYSSLFNHLSLGRHILLGTLIFPGILYACPETEFNSSDDDVVQVVSWLHGSADNITEGSNTFTGLAKSRVIWPFSTDGSKVEIPVCFRSTAIQSASNFEPSEFQMAKRIIRDAAEKTWMKYSLATFTGWQECPAVFPGLVVSLSNRPVDTHAATFGSDIKGMRGGLLFKIATTSSAHLNEGCANFTCTYNVGSSETQIYARAVHEYGHVLGFLHEQERADISDWCKKTDMRDIAIDQSGGDVTIGKWDAWSVMNYCNKSKKLSNYGELTETDIATVKYYYDRIPVVSVEDNEIILTLPVIRFQGATYKAVLQGDAARKVFRLKSLTPTTLTSKTVIEVASLESSIVLPYVADAINPQKVQVYLKPSLRYDAAGGFFTVQGDLTPR